MFSTEKKLSNTQNILIISHKFLPYVGGIEIMTLFLANTFVNAGFNVRVLTWTEEEYDKELPFSVVRKPNLSIIFKEYNWADIVFENNPVLRLSWPLIILRKPLVIVLHTWINRTDGNINWQDRLKVLWLKRANKIIAVSNALRDKSAKKALVIENPYRTEEFKILNDIKRDRDFVFLGRLVSDKGAHLTILALQKLNKLGYEMNLTIIGEGPEKDNLKQLVNDAKLDKSVNFTGILQDVELVEMLNKHKFILVPSIWEEPFGLVALEGMACGCIPIVSNGGGLPEAVGEAGLIFERDDLSSFVAAIESVLLNPFLQIKLQGASIKHLINHHSDVIGKRYLQVVNDILNK